MDAHQVITNFINIDSVSSVASYFTPNICFGIFVTSLIILSGTVTMLLCSKHEKDIEEEINDEEEIRLKAIEHNIGVLSSLYVHLEKSAKSNEKKIEAIQTYINDSSE